VLQHLEALKKEGRECATEEATWKRDTLKVCRDKNVRLADCAVTEKVAKARWYRALPKREQLGLAVWSTVNPELNKLELHPSVDRMNVVTEDKLSTLMPHQRWWLQDSLRVLTGAEALLVHGWPRDIVLAFRKSDIGKSLVAQKVNLDNLCQDLAGNSFVGTVIAAFILAILANLTPHMVQWAKQAWTAICESRNGNPKAKVKRGMPKEVNDLLLTLMEGETTTGGSADEACGAAGPSVGEDGEVMADVHGEVHVQGS
jgi:hypothetical protein